MKVSVIIPCYNCEKYILETLNSVVSQNYQDYEIIAINDCSKDNTENLLHDFAKKETRLKVISNEKNLGVALTRNKGVEFAKGEYIAFLDSDDVWLPNKLQLQMNEILSDESIDLICTSYILYDSELKNIISTYNTRKDISYSEMLYENLIGLSTVVIKKEVFLKFKMSNKYIHEDYELWLKLLRNNCKFKGIREPLVKYRVLQTSRNYSKINSFIGRTKILYCEEKISLIKIIKCTLVYALRGFTKYKSM